MTFMVQSINVYYDEVLTQSIRSFIFTGHSSWKDRYDQFGKEYQDWKAILATSKLLASIVIAALVLIYSFFFSERIAAGDMSQDFEFKQRNEIGRLADSFREMSLNLSRIVGTVKASVSNVSSGSQQMSSTAQQMSQGATEQAASAEEVSASMEEMASSIKLITENAQETEGIGLKTAKDIEEGASAVTKSVSAIKEIATKISIIDEIARQTNLLALNATIEAARAGEVRKLAEWSQKASGESGDLSRITVEDATKAGEIIQKLVPDIKKTADLVQEISSASRERGDGEHGGGAVQPVRAADAGYVVLRGPGSSDGPATPISRHSDPGGVRLPAERISRRGSGPDPQGGRRKKQADWKFIDRSK